MLIYSFKAGKQVAVAYFDSSTAIRIKPSVLKESEATFVNVELGDLELGKEVMDRDFDYVEVTCDKGDVDTLKRFAAVLMSAAGKAAKLTD